jgi:hypothetical protein
MSEHGGPRGGSGHLIGRMIMRASVVTGSYGLIVLPPVGQKPRPTLTGLRYRWTARLGRARASAILSDSECCREMFSYSNLFLSHQLEEVPFGANFVLGCSFPYSCLLKAAARSTVDFPRRCPFPGIVRVPFRDEESAVISRYFKSRCRDFAPNPCGSRYQTAGSIGALARDEPVTPGVTFLSHPAPNSEDLNDR